MKCKILVLCATLAGCGAPSDRLTDEQAAAEQNAAIEETVAIDVPEPITTAPPPPSPTLSYKALGTEPGWALTVTPKTINYEGEYGSVVISEPTPPRFRPGPGRYAGTRIAVTIAPGPCSDGMSDRTYRHTVTVVVDGKSVSGCGGGTMPASEAPAETVTEPTNNAI
jgi:uncharacterized membrane protein